MSRRTASRLTAAARGLAALVVLLALLAGVPLLLWRTGVLPAHVPTMDEVTGALTSTDNGTLFLGALTLLGWGAWLSFVFSTVVEATALLRHRQAPRVRVLGATQRLAASLVAGVVLLLPTSAAFAAAPSAGATTVTAPVSVQSVGSTQTAAHSEAPSSWTGPVHHVVHGDTLWDLAAHYLGDGTRWREIAQLNDGLRQPDGAVTTSNVRELHPGWTLRLPPEAKAPAHESAAPAAGGAHHEHVVAAGETLTGIAHDELGDAGRFEEIASLNKGHVQADGQALQDPDQINAGWTLELPAAATAAPEPAPAAPTSPTTPADQAPAAPSQSAAPSAAATPAPATTPTQQAAPTTAPTSEATTPSAPTAPGEADTPAAVSTTDDAEDTDMLKMVVGGTSLLAASVLATVGGRRAIQRRRRRFKRRIPMPVPESASADLERQLRITADVSSLSLIDHALRTLAANCASTGQALPEIEAARILPRGVELHLAQPTPPIEPFTEMEEHPDRWWCPARGAALLDEDEARDTTSPYPALVSLGETEDGEAVMVNLEAVGLLRLYGTPADVRAVMLGMAVELGSSQLADDTTVLLNGLGEELEDAFPARIDHKPALAEAIPDLIAHDAMQRGVLGEDSSLFEARLTGDGGDTWTPKILLSPTAPDAHEAESLIDLLSSRPRTAVAVVTTADDALDLPGAWTLSATPGGTVALPGLDLSITLQRLEDETYGPLLELLGTASRTDDVAAPAWTHPPHGAPVPNGPSRIPVSAGLAPDTTPQPADEHDGEPAEEHSARPIAVSFSKAPVGLATSLPGFSALAPSVTGASAPAHAPAVDQPLDDDMPPEPEDDFGDEPEADPFEEALSEVLQEQARPAVHLDDAELHEEDEPAGDAENDASALSQEAVGAHAPVPAPAAAPRVTAVTSSVLAALNTPPDPPAAPQIRVLGSVDVIGTLGKVESNRRNGLTEIAAWLVLHPGSNRHELGEAIWPGQRVRADTRNTSISKLRTWVGRDPLLAPDDPQGAYLPPISDGVYGFNDQVTSDWTQFQELYQLGMHHHGTDADIALAHALALVRGRPFSDIDQSKYSWAEYPIQEMLSAIVDVAHELATRRLAVRDYRAAGTAASKGLLCDPQSELLFRDLIALYSETGDRAGLERTAQQLARIAVDSGCDSSPETVSLINALMDADRIASA
ncbi:LysM peptidoglycan-binding domain-containing protein [Kitasatospora sp. NBC_00240]|uniref:LysM peptidoglycan-binding domain-containing protein n=1 Tax=Kitasatospora sp. NBC_00240 TaxID=2903567 RepID=UPI00225A7DF7|nr:LysM peptidoglycan-binding domain-containing protein [Kitasatospora sp. NBC_00240]MCX5215702.1 LysM peptidoglycan-binding domain-containing protein [Kitasatospora sp. NBC_00240]